jgi:hypothetical protein
MVGQGTMMRACCCGSQCYYRPFTPSPRSWTRVHIGCPSPRVVEEGLGGWGRDGLAALALISLVGSVVAIARGMRLGWGRRSWGIVDLEYLWGSHGRVGAESDLLQD